MAEGGDCRKRGREDIDASDYSTHHGGSLAGQTNFSPARRTFRRLRGKSTSGHPVLVQMRGMLAHCSFPIKRVTSRTIIFRFRQRASATSRLPTWMLTERFKLLVLN